MDKKAMPIKMILLVLGVASVLASYFLVKGYILTTGTVREGVWTDQPFNEQNYNFVITDSFETILKQAYKEDVSVITQGGKMMVDLQHANAVTKDFINGNDGLLKYKINDHGFEIRYDPNEQKIHAVFAVKDNAVPVPNDVLLRITDKIYNK